MEVKRWLDEDKGGFGLFLILVIMGLFFYALQQKYAGNNKKLAQTKIEEIIPTRLVVARKTLSEARPAHSGQQGQIALSVSDSALLALGTAKEANKLEVKKAGSSTNIKAKPISAKRKLSKEDIVRSKLKAGMSVNKIAKATGYKRGDIRRIKRMKVCY